MLLKKQHWESETKRERGRKEGSISAAVKFSILIYEQNKKNRSHDHHQRKSGSKLRTNVIPLIYFFVRSSFRKLCKRSKYKIVFARQTYSHAKGRRGSNPHHSQINQNTQVESTAPCNSLLSTRTCSHDMLIARLLLDPPPHHHPGHMKQRNDCMLIVTEPSAPELIVSKQSEKCKPEDPQLTERSPCRTQGNSRLFRPGWGSPSSHPPFPSSPPATHASKLLHAVITHAGGLPCQSICPLFTVCRCLETGRRQDI